MKRSVSRFDRLLHLGALQDPRTGHYGGVRLSRTVNAQLDQQLRQQHQRFFADWLVLNLEQQYEEIREYLARCDEDPRTLIRRWAQAHWYARLVPATAIAPERALFMSDFEIVLALVHSDLQPNNGEPRPVTLSWLQLCYSGEAVCVAAQGAEERKQENRRRIVVADVPYDT